MQSDKFGIFHIFTLWETLEHISFFYDDTLSKLGSFVIIIKVAKSWLWWQCRQSYHQNNANLDSGVITNAYDTTRKEAALQRCSRKRCFRERCSEKMQQIYRRTPMPKCDFNKVAKQFSKQFYWNRTLAWVFSTKFAAYFQNIFS